MDRTLGCASEDRCVVTTGCVAGAVVIDSEGVAVRMLGGAPSEASLPRTGAAGTEGGVRVSAMNPNSPADSVTGAAAVGALEAMGGEGTTGRVLASNPRSPVEDCGTAGTCVLGGPSEDVSREATVCLGSEGIAESGVAFGTEEVGTLPAGEVLGISETEAVGCEPADASGERCRIGDAAVSLRENCDGGRDPISFRVIDSEEAAAGIVGRASSGVLRTGAAGVAGGVRVSSLSASEASATSEIGASGCGPGGIVP